MFVNQNFLERHPANFKLACLSFCFNFLVCSVLLSNLVLIGCRDEPSPPTLDGFGSTSPPEIISLGATIAVNEASNKAGGASDRVSKSPSYIHKPSSLPHQTAEKPPISQAILFLNDHEEFQLPELTAGQLHKNFTLILLAAQPDLRARKILKPISKSLTEKQESEAIKLILAHDYKFLKLQRRRSEILEHAQTGHDIESELKRIDSETVATSMNLQRAILKSTRKKIIK